MKEYSDTLMPNPNREERWNIWTNEDDTERTVTPDSNISVCGGHTPTDVDGRPMHIVHAFTVKGEPTFYSTICRAFAYAKKWEYDEGVWPEGVWEDIYANIGRASK